MSTIEISLSSFLSQLSVALLSYANQCQFILAGKENAQIVAFLGILASACFPTTLTFSAALCNLSISCAPMAPSNPKCHSRHESKEEKTKVTKAG